VDGDDLAVAPDGSPVLLYLVLPGEEEAALVHASVRPGDDILELGCGPGRVTRPLVALGHRVTGVDNSPAMLAHLGGVESVEPVLAELAELDLRPRRWSCVLMASHLVNDDQGEAFLTSAARHVAPDGCVLVQRHEPGWVDGATVETRERAGVTMRLEDVDHPVTGRLVATMVYEVRGQRFAQRFTANEVDDDRLATMAAAQGCVVDSVLDDRATWIRLRPTATARGTER
jgi:SAM-dependent methyltransferase